MLLNKVTAEAALLVPARTAFRRRVTNGHQSPVGLIAEHHDCRHEGELTKFHSGGEDHGAPMTQAEFHGRAWKLANDKARELGWIVSLSRLEKNGARLRRLMFVLDYLAKAFQFFLVQFDQTGLFVPASAPICLAEARGSLMAKLTRQLHERVRGDNTESRTGGGLFSTLKPSAFILSMNGAIRTRGEPPAQTMGLRISISTASLPRVKPQPNGVAANYRERVQKGGGENA